MQFVFDEITKECLGRRIADECDLKQSFRNELMRIVAEEHAFNNNFTVDDGDSKCGK